MFTKISAMLILSLGLQTSLALAQTSATFVSPDRPQLSSTPDGSALFQDQLCTPGVYYCADLNGAPSSIIAVGDYQGICQGNNDCGGANTCQYQENQPYCA